jgi:hypothetical protein
MMRVFLSQIVILSLIKSFIVGYTTQLPFVRHGNEKYSWTCLFEREEMQNSDDQPIMASTPSFPQFDPSNKLELRKDKMNVGNPQIVVVEEPDMTVTDILRELAAIRQEGPQKYCILGTRHCSYLHQQIIELL